MSLTITPSPFGSLLVSVAETGSTLSVTTVATSPSILSMALGVPGPQGDAGPAGANGQGVAVGGLTNQVLVKLSNADYDTGWANAGTGDYLPLTGGTMSGNIVYGTEDELTNNVILGSGGLLIGYDYNNYRTVINPNYLYFHEDVNNGSLTINATDGYYFNNSQGNVSLNYNGVSGSNENSNWGIGSNGITFPDGSTQASAYNPSVLNGYLPLTGGTVTGNVSVYDIASPPVEILFEVGNGISVYDNDTNTGTYLSTGGLTFPDSTTQTTAFPPTGGTTSQYIDGTGALQTFPTAATKMVTTVRNNSGATISKGTVVYINGAVGNKPTIAKAQANSESTSKATFAFVQTDILNNTEGDVVQLGLLENIDTQGFTDGQQIFLSPTTAGGWTSTQPFSPYHYVRLGTIIRGGHPTQGSISVQIINGFQLDELSDVGSTAPSNNNVLTWNSATSQWLDKSISTILGYTPLSSTTASSTYLTISSASSTYQTQSGMSAYLSTASASSTYQTQSGMSAYLSTSAASSTYQTQAGMSAYLSTSAASTTYIAQSQYATTAQAQAGSSTSAVISASTFFDGKVFAGYKPLSLIYTWTSATSGTGAFSTVSGLAKIVSAPTSSTGYAQAIILNNNASRGQQYTSGADFSKRTIIGGRFVKTVTSADTNSVFRYTLGKFIPSTPVGDLAARGIGFRQVANGALELQVHNGSNLYNVTSSFTPTANQSFDVIIISDGSGNATMYVNGLSVATSANSPTALLGANTGALVIEAQNTSTIAGSAMSYVGTDMFVQTNL